MKRLMHIEASPRGTRSRSGAIGLHLLRGLQASVPELEIVTLNLFDAALPAFDGAAIEGRYQLLHGEPVDVVSLEQGRRGKDVGLEVTEEIA